MVDYVDTTGRRRLKTFLKKKEADAFAANATVEIRDGVHVADSATVTIEVAAKLWIKSCEAAELERTTIAGYQREVDLLIVPLMGDMKLNKITVPVVRDFQDKLREKGRSASRVKRVTISLGSILSDAQDRGLIVRNAVAELSRRRSNRSSEKRQKSRIQYGIDIPTIEEIRLIIGAAEGRYRPFIITAIFTGMRSSELRGLPWRNVDLDKAVIHVQQRADAYLTIGMPKSLAGQRSIPLPPIVVNTLREWKIACPLSELDLVFPTGTGKVQYYTNIVKRGLHKTLIEAGVTVAGENGPLPKYTGLHALRHWFASWCINSKADGGLELTPKAVQTRMGHSSIQVTFDTYGHLFPAVNETQALAAAEAALLA